MSKLFIDGVWCHSGATREIRCPADGSFVRTVSEAGPPLVAEAVDAARRAFDGPWRAVSSPERAALLLRVADLLTRDRAVYADAAADKWIAANRTRSTPGCPADRSVERVQVRPTSNPAHARPGRPLRDARTTRSRFCSLIRRSRVHNLDRVSEPGS